MAKYKKKFRPQRQHRYERLRSEYFSLSESRLMSTFALKMPYIKSLRQHRRAQTDSAVKWARARSLKRTDAILRLREIIKEEYKENGWKDAYAMVRAERDKSLARGDYTPPPAKRVTRPRLSKGNVNAQKARRLEREAARKPYEVYGKNGELIGHAIWSPREQRFIKID